MSEFNLAGSGGGFQGSIVILLNAAGLHHDRGTTCWHIHDLIALLDPPLLLPPAVGYGDITPKNQKEKVLTIFVMCRSVGIRDGALFAQNLLVTREYVLGTGNEYSYGQLSVPGNTCQPHGQCTRLIQCSMHA
jgi:hypothetical protein